MQVDGLGPVPDPTTAVVDSVLTALMAVGRTMRQRVEGDDLEPGVFWLMKNVASRGPLRVTELASCTNLDTSTVSRHVAQLHRAGLLERTPDPDDGRAHRLQLTETGRSRLHDAFERRRTLLRRALGGWEADDVAELDRLLGRFVTDIENVDAELEHA
ncbi:DNA-binding transcriptional regulator, MarR family [Friedmanniella luteola]|uniref:DNA-binding transcriptional regulator, MarR family n=1 Tax=Friedmanniella luteola TaxID=546871 RepID=A0A1H1N560_9ACTN|nr:MarR family winged helix-turn-helix transcriptional regulator [Friedmanniella luteola]SDR93865.1 DNA-binding transcriptional regulator, MarR family [Friedmanniella luteola]